MNRSDMTRRELIQIGAAVCAVGAVGAAPATNSSPHFFSAEEFAMLDELTELIIPTDEHSPGARAAGVAAYIDGTLSESVIESEKNQWRDGVRRVDALTNKLHGRSFMQATLEQRVAVLSHMAHNEANPQTPEELFFVQLKSSTASAYYSSKTGIHQEMEYKGNVLLDEFAGYEVK